LYNRNFFFANFAALREIKSNFQENDEKTTPYAIRYLRRSAPVPGAFPCGNRDCDGLQRQLDAGH
jgi:hypothetical protein